MFSSNTSQVVAVSTQPEAIDFSTSDYIEKTTALTGGTATGTFTFSVWLWPYLGDQIVYQMYNSAYTQVRFYAYYQASSNTFSILGKTSSNATVLDMSIPFSGNSILQTFYHILVSVDLSNSTKRSVYINDEAVSSTWTTYLSGSIDFTQPNNQVAYGAGAFDGRISNFFLDFAYRDLSVTANRRLFITADRKPAAGQAALNPILYFTMADPTQPGKNSGTGGNFTLTGTVARSGRGPNQYNAPYSTFDGSADFMSRGPLTGIANSTSFLLAFNFQLDSNSSQRWIFRINDSTSAAKFQIYTTTAGITVAGHDSAGISVFQADYNVAPVVGRNYNVVVSRGTVTAMYVNGVEIAGAITVDSGTINFAPTSPGTNTFIACRFSNVDLFPGKIGGLWFSPATSLNGTTRTLDKFVTGTGIDAKPVDLGASGELPTGTSPRVYLPMYGNNAGKNYGTGGDFTVNSGPYTGARGPNEFWGNWAVFDSTDYLLQSSIALSTSTITLSFFITVTAVSGDGYIFEGWTSGNSTRFRCTLTGARYLRLEGWNSSGVKVLDITSNGMLSGSTTPYHVAISFNLSNSAQRHFYINNVDVASSWSTYSSGTMNIAKTYISSNNLPLFNSKLAEFYLSTTYIDFSQEANRLKFRDAFGNPVNLTQQIEAAAIPNPAIYMRFAPASFGTNSGTGGNFTVNGTITDGGQL